MATPTGFVNPFLVSRGVLTPNQEEIEIFNKFVESYTPDTKIIRFELGNVTGVHTTTLGSLLIAQVHLVINDVINVGSQILDDFPEEYLTLWSRGLVPTYILGKWCLHAGDTAQIVYIKS